ncbi:ferredoxin--NADP reductase [Pedobacter cryoconitis]|uniref:Ring-1,2-phenylacetyl-CoA epoxidase subunit PaaE n=1 Tax=Pedobacter cryoconitis TaxID=188932 RepID=A0A7X0MKB9_9SPHI|nr:ferredoxin--NADP reductase [Pedobacter cryoconitis]MBB6502397.1 ring-1,2-phenylacetyl-CoA epoxidase subunit PaaE [Pedobacter cryoconitis]
MVTYTLKVIDKINETQDTVTVCFKQPALRKIKYKAGQYLTLIFRINGRRYLRPYSFSSAPVIDTTLDVTVKRIHNGIVSNHIHDVVKVGDSIEVLSPMGDFIYENNEADVSQIFLWGVGSGITPLISLTKYVLAEYPDIRINLVYGNRNHESTIFSNLINELLIKHPERFKVWYFHTLLSVTDASPFLVQGRINKKSVFNVMKGIIAEQSQHYICGPLGLKDSVKEALSELNVPNSRVLSEDFELIRDPGDFNDVQTQSVNLKFENQEYILEVVKGKSILECALDAGIELPYSCQTGNCNTCKAKLKNGDLKMIGLSQERTDLLSDEYLLCCSHPLTKGVSLEV